MQLQKKRVEAPVLTSSELVTQRSRERSLTRDGIVIAEADLNLCRQVKDLWGLRMTARYADYAELLKKYCEPGFKPQVIKDSVE